MKSIRFGLVVIAICGILTIGAGAQIGVWQRQVMSLSERQDALADQLLELRNALVALIDTETGQRGYLLSGQDEYLQPYEDGRQNAARALSRLAELSRSDPATLATVEELRKIAEAKEDELARTIALRRGGDLGAALEIFRTGEGKQLADAFRARATPLLLQLRATRAALGAQEGQIFQQMMVLGGLVLVLIIALVAVAIRWLSASIQHLAELQARREQEAMHDALTTLPNRRYLNEWMKMTLAAARRGRQRVAVLYFDLDGFKAVNDRFGHEAGDRVLQVTAVRLRGGVRGEDFVARLGGDEFVAVLPDAPGQPELSTLVARLGRDLGKAPLAELADGDVAASIGHASYPEDGDTLDALVTAADRSMYAVKESRRRSAAQSLAGTGIAANLSSAR